MERSFIFLRLLPVTFTALLLSVAAGDSNICPLWAQKPLNFTFLVAGEQWCPKQVFTHICYSCCQQTDTVCCDDGTCMDYDQYCRYPKECCKAPYCDEQCCSSTHGIPCGPVCAPKASTQCCNPSTGQLCSTSDTCCNDFCCPPSTHCCTTANRCLQQGETCCGTISCDTDSFCCGNMPNKCCSVGYECVAESGGCCLPEKICLDAPNKCCNNGSHCCGHHCCPDEQLCCNDTCCATGHTCCDGKCCSSEIGCQTGGECCPQGQVCGLTCCSDEHSCCDDHHCCPPGLQCCGDLCCPSGESCCHTDKKCYPSGITECVDRCCPPGSTCIQDHFGIRCCAGHYCGSTGICCSPGASCNQQGHCCHDTTKLCPGGSNEACYPMSSTCCSDGTACPSNYPVCVVEGGTSGGKACCPAGTHSMCGGICRPPSFHDCSCCGTNCCFAPYSCDGLGKCFHDYTTGSWWSGHRHHHDPIQLPPPPTNKIEPAAFPCFQNAATMNDTCAAWDCLEEIIKCGSKGPIQYNYQLICKDFRDFKNLFNTEGQDFLSCTADCVTAEVVSILKDNNIKPCCASLVLWQNSKDRFECWAGCGFCTAYITNHLGFKVIFDRIDPGANPLSIYGEHCHLG